MSRDDVRRDNREIANQDFLAGLADLTASMGLPPTVRELQGHLAVSSTSVVTYRMNELIEAGFVQRRPSARPYDTRLWVLTDKGRAAAKQGSAA